MARAFVIHRPSVNTRSHTTADDSKATRTPGALAAGFVVLGLTACATTPTPPPPVQVLDAQLLVFDDLSGEHLLLDAGSSRARTLAAAHPARLARLASPSSGVLTLGNVQIPLNLGAPRAPASLIPDHPPSKESAP